MNKYWMLLCFMALSSSGCPDQGAPGDHGDDHHEGHNEGHEEGEPHDEGEAGHADVVTLSAEAIEGAGIALAPAASGRLVPVLSTSARIALDPTRHALVGAWIEGQVDAIQVRSGDRVVAGARLGTVHTPELGTAVGAYRSARAREKAAEARLERLQMLEAGGVSSRAQVLDAEASLAEVMGTLEAAEERLRVLGVDPAKGDPSRGEHYPAHVPVTSPIPGEVLQVLVSVGQQVRPGDALFRVGDLSEVWLLADIYAGDLSKVSQGQAVTFTTEAWPGEIFTGRVDRVGSWVDPAARTVELRAVVPNPGEKLKPNMYAQVALQAGDPEGPEGITLPEDAVVTVEGRPSVFVQTSPGTFEARDVTVAEAAGGTVRLKEGVAAGEMIVMEGAFALKSALEKGALGDGHAH